MGFVEYLGAGGDLREFGIVAGEILQKIGGMPERLASLQDATQHGPAREVTCGAAKRKGQSQLGKDKAELSGASVDHDVYVEAGASGIRAS